MKTYIKFWGGLRTIGGNIASIEYGNDRVIFDFGLVYNPATNILDHHIEMREQFLVRDYLRLGLIPRIPGIYSQTMLDRFQKLMSAEEDTTNTAVFISHLHLDHMGAMGLIAPRIPVYLSESSLALYNLLEEVDEGVQGHRSYSGCAYEQTIHIGEIRVTPIRVDHDVFGAVSYHVQTPDGSFVYSGDLRMHGQHPEWNHRWLEMVKTLGVDVLMIEGTTLHPERMSPLDRKERLTEAEIPTFVAKLGNRTEGLVLFNMYQRNIDRIENFSKAAGLLNRQLVLEPATAYLALQLLPNVPFSVFLSSRDQQTQQEQALPSWKELLFTTKEIVTSEMINEVPSQYLLQNSYSKLLDLLDIDLQGSLYIHANGVPLGEFDPAYANLLRFLEQQRIQFQSLNVSGHAYPEDLFYLADALNPRTLIPWHAYHPELFLTRQANVLLPKYETVYQLDKGVLKEV